MPNMFAILRYASAICSVNGSLCVGDFTLTRDSGTLLAKAEGSATIVLDEFVDCTSTVVYRELSDKFQELYCNSDKFEQYLDYAMLTSYETKYVDYCWVFQFHGGYVLVDDANRKVWYYDLDTIENHIPFENQFTLLKIKLTFVMHLLNNFVNDSEFKRVFEEFRTVTVSHASGVTDVNITSADILLTQLRMHNVIIEKMLSRMHVIECEHARELVELIDIRTNCKDKWKLANLDGYYYSILSAVIDGKHRCLLCGSNFIIGYNLEDKDIERLWDEYTASDSSESTDYFATHPVTTKAEFVRICTLMGVADASTRLDAFLSDIGYM